MAVNFITSNPVVQVGGGQGADLDATIARMSALVRHPGLTAPTRINLMHTLATMQSQQAANRESMQNYRPRMLEQREQGVDDRRGAAAQRQQERAAATMVQLITLASQSADPATRQQFLAAARRVHDQAQLNAIPSEGWDALRSNPQALGRLSQGRLQERRQVGAPAVVPVPSQAPALDRGGGPGDDGMVAGGSGDDTPPVQIVQAPQARPASPLPGPSAGYLDILGNQEAAGRNNPLPNPRSSAAGPYQFLAGTWLGRPDAPGIAARLQGVDQNRLRQAWAGDQDAQREILALRTDPALARTGVGEYARRTAAFFRQQQPPIPINDTTLALAHFLGPAGATRFLRIAQANPAAPIASAVTPAALRANPGVFTANPTAGALLRSYEGRYGAQAAMPGTAAPDSSVTRAPLPPWPGVPSTMPGRMDDVVPTPDASVGAGAGLVPAPGRAAASAPSPADAARNEARFSAAEQDAIRAEARNRINADPSQRERILSGLRRSGIATDGIGAGEQVPLPPMPAPDNAQQQP